MSFTVSTDRLALKRPFTIARGTRTHAHVLRVAVTRDGVTGQGECLPYARYGETLESVTQAIAALPHGIDREALQTALPAGAARNAIDCALWDLQAKAAGRSVWDLAGLVAPAPLLTAFTLSLDTPAAMRAQAAEEAARPLLKIKLGGGPEDLDRLRAVRAGAPEARIVVDANEGWSVDDYRHLAPALADLGVEMVEQPFAAGQDDALADLDRPVPVCADESCHDRASLPGMAGKYDMINIKLDKTGGLTEALALRDAAQAAGLSVMVGCMLASSLAMAPAVLVAQGAAVVDLDGPLLLAEDRAPAIRYDGSRMEPAAPELWG
ncbi:MAG: N-acetyl-D-Glu racemase DgcA [Pseudomonadota bacterium]